MKKNKKLLMFLALNSLATSFAGTVSGQIEEKYDKLYNNMVKNIEMGKSNEKNYKLIQDVLNKRNQELKDLYVQSNYIVKPEYLEWQVFFTGFYNSSNRGGKKSSISTITNGEPKSVDLGIVIPVQGMTRDNISLNLTSPPEKEKNVSIPEINVIMPETVNYIPVSVEVNAVSGLAWGLPDKFPGRNSVITGEATNIIAYNASGTKIFENLNIESVAGTTVQWDDPDSLTMSGAVNYSNNGVIGTTNANEPHIGQSTSISVLNTGINGNFTVNGDWTLNANYTGENTFAFLSYRPSFITGNSSVIYDGTLTLNRGSGSRGNLVRLSLNLENSTASALPTASLENKGDIFIEGTPNTTFGRTISMQLDPLSSLSAIKGELINSGKITVENSGNRGLNDPRPTALLVNSGDVSPTANVKIGNIDLMADNSIGFEIGSGVNPLSGVKADGSNGVIRVLGFVSNAVTIGNAVGTDTGDNLIGGLQNLNIFIDGARSQGIYLTDLPSVDDKNIILDDKVVQSITFGDNATFGVMVFNNSMTNNVIIDSSLANVTDFNKGDDKRIIVNTGLSLKNYMPITIINSENTGGTAIVNSGRPDDVSLENYGDITINSECPTCTYIGEVVPTVGIINDRGVMKNFSNVTINADNVYAVASNNGTITLNDGDITVNGDYATAIISFYQQSGPTIQPIINLESGNVYLNGSNGQVFYISEGIIGLGSAENTVNATVSGENSYLFSKLYNREDHFLGKFNINGDVNSVVDKGAAAFYYIGQVFPDPYYPPMDFLSDLSNLFVINSGTLTIDVKDDGYLFGLTKMGLKVSDLDNIQLSGINLIGSKKVKLSNSALYIDNDSNLDYQNNTGNTGYRDLEYFDTDIFLDSGITVTGTENRQTGMKLAGAATSFLYHYGENNGTINFSGDNSIGAYARNSKIVNNGLIDLGNSQNGTGIYAELYEHQSSESHFYRNTEVYNAGDIKIGENGIGIYANTKKIQI